MVFIYHIINIVYSMKVEKKASRAM